MLKKDSDALFTNLKFYEENTRKIQKSFEDERTALRKLTEEHRAANEIRQKAYIEWTELRNEPSKKVRIFTCCSSCSFISGSGLLNIQSVFLLFYTIHKFEQYHVVKCSEIQSTWLNLNSSRRFLVTWNEFDVLGITLHFKFHQVVIVSDVSSSMPLVLCLCSCYQNLITDNQ